MIIKEALNWIKDKGWRDVTVESDCLVVIEAIRSSVSLVSPLGRVIQECRNMILDLQHRVSLFFIKQYANMMAHELPKASFDRSCVPIGVVNALKND